MSLRRRLLLSLGLTVTLAFTIFAITEYRTLQQALLVSVDTTLAIRAQALVERLKSRPLGPGDLSLTEDPLTAGSLVYVQIIGPDGTVLAASDNLRGQSLPRPERDGEFATVLIRPGADLRVYRQDAVTSQLVSTVVVGESLQQIEDALKASAGKILLAGLVALTIAYMLGLAVLTHSLQPLSRVGQIAEEIVATGDVSKRVPVPPGQDRVVQVARSFNALLERVGQVLETQNRLLSDTSHELRNPLMVIQTDLDMLGQELDAETRREVVAEAASEMSRVIRLLEDLLLVSWVEAGPRLRHEAVRLDTLGSRATARQTALAGERRLECRAEEVWVNGDPDRLEQILRNLIQNAIHYTSSDGTIEVQIHKQGPQAVVRVSDNGCGIAPAHLQHIFERFYRVDPSRSRRSGGSGLGLPVAQALARMHGGDLVAESQVGVGSTFTLYLPALEEVPDLP